MQNSWKLHTKRNYKPISKFYEVKDIKARFFAQILNEQVTHKHSEKKTKVFKMPLMPQNFIQPILLVKAVKMVFFGCGDVM